MAIQLSTTVRNARLDAIETDAGVSCILRIRSGAPPADCGTADSGTVLAEMTLPSDWMNAASGGTKDKAGTWEDTSANATGTAGHFRVYRSNGTTVVMQGTVGQGSGDMSLDNTSLVTTQTVTITAFTLTDGNA